MKKLKVFLMSLLPVFSWIAVQFLVSAGFTVLFMILPAIFELLNLDTYRFMDYVSREYIYIVSVWMSAVFWIPGIIWYRSLTRMEEKRAEFSLKSGVRLVLLGLFLQLTVSLLLSVAEMLFPQTMEAYGQVMESLGMGNPSVLSVIYVGIMAPVTEELVFRGLTLKLLQRGFSFPAANVIQAIYFGVVHGNLVQGLYAFAIGLLLGKIAQKNGNLKSSILCHMAVNFSGLLLGCIPVGGISIIAGSMVLAGAIYCLRD